MTGRLLGPTSHEEQARPPGEHGAWGGGGSTARPRERPVRHSSPGARPGNAHDRFSLPQGRPPLPERWRRGSCSEAVGLKQRKKPLPFPAMTSAPRRHRPPLCLSCPRRGNVPPRHNVLLTWGPTGAAGGAAVPAGPASPRRSLAICSTPSLTALPKKTITFSPAPPVVVFSFPPLRACSAKVRAFAIAPRRPEEGGGGKEAAQVTAGCLFPVAVHRSR